MARPAASDTSAYRADIDGLRAVAILAVVAHHALPELLPGGYVGVDVFFVISGYLISRIIINGLRRNDFRIRDFYARRIRRIFPALFAVLAATLWAGWFLLLPDELDQLGRHVVAGAAFVQNIVLWREAGYFDTASETKPLMHLWSLAVEEQFYLAYPVLLAIAWRARTLVPALLLLLLTTSFALNTFILRHDAAAAFFLPHTRLWELLTGCLLAWHHCATGGNGGETSNRNPRLANDAVAMLGILLILGATVFLQRTDPFPGWRALLPVAGAVLLIHSGEDTWVARRLLTSRIMVGIGLISYSLYLWHWPILSFQKIVAPTSDHAATRVLLVLVAILLAWLTYKYIERPIRFSRRHSLVVPGAAVMVLATAAVGLAFAVNDGFGSRFSPYSADAYAFLFETHMDGWHDCSFMTVTDPEAAGCEVLRPGEAVQVAVIGDSHAGHLASGLRDFFSGRGENVALLWGAGCNPIRSIQQHGKDYFVCPEDLMNRAIDLARDEETIKTVVLSGYANSRIHENRYHEARHEDPEFLESNASAFEAALDTTLQELTEAGKRVVYVMDTPELWFDPRACARALMWQSVNDTCSVSRKAAEERFRVYHEAVRRLQQRHPEVVFIDTWPAFCDSIRCHAATDGALLYQTRDHLSPAGSRYLVNGFVGPYIAHSRTNIR